MIPECDGMAMDFMMASGSIAFYEYDPTGNSVKRSRTDGAEAKDDVTKLGDSALCGTAAPRQRT